jgi:hypothetical protein
MKARGSPTNENTRRVAHPPNDVTMNDVEIRARNGVGRRTGTRRGTRRNIEIRMGSEERTRGEAELTTLWTNPIASSSLTAGQTISTCNMEDSMLGISPSIA